LKEQEPLLTEYFDVLVKALHDECEGNSNGVVDLVKWLNFTTFDIIGDLVFSESFHALENRNYHFWISNIFRGIKSGRDMRIMKQYPLLSKTFRYAQGLVSTRPGDMEARRRHLSYTADKTKRRLKLKTEKPDFMSFILRHNDERGMTEKEIIRTSSTLILAGSETTATFLSGFFYNLLLPENEQVYHKVKQEVRSAFSTISEITIVAAGKLEYLYGCIEESFRRYPPVPGLLPRKTIKTEEIDGYVIPPGVSSTNQRVYSRIRCSQNTDGSRNSPIFSVQFSRTFP
jgi:cytochrome P450